MKLSFYLSLPPLAVHMISTRLPHQLAIQSLMLLRDLRHRSVLLFHQSDSVLFLLFQLLDPVRRLGQLFLQLRAAIVQLVVDAASRLLQVLLQQCELVLQPIFLDLQIAEQPHGVDSMDVHLSDDSIRRKRTVNWRRETINSMSFEVGTFFSISFTCSRSFLQSYDRSNRPLQTVFVIIDW